LILALSLPLSAQAPSFDAASIRKSEAADLNGGSVVLPGPRFRATNMTLVGLIVAAYNIPSYRIMGGPDWIRRDRFDVEAKAEEGTPMARVPSLIQMMLGERFSLVVHREKREIPTYSLVTTRDDQRLGLGLSRSDVDCGDSKTRQGTRNGAPACGFTVGTGTIRGGAIPVDTLAQLLSQPAGRPVANHTNLQGSFNVDLEWSPFGADTGDAPSIFSAVQEQLGLRLQPDKALHDMLVVDMVQPPSAN
jgi:uncharacterized protein (TIGR03435 family)